MSSKMVAETELICHQSVSVLDMQYLCVPKANNSNQIDGILDASSSSSPIFCAPEPFSAEITRFESVVSCMDTIQDAVIKSPSVQYVPTIRSGSYSDIGSRRFMEDEHIRIDDLSTHLGSFSRCPSPSAFYAVFDGHGGPDAAAYVKRNAMRLFFEDSNMPQISDIDELLLEALEISHRKAFLLADRALANECSVSTASGTTALTALVLGKLLLVANAGDCRAVLCRKGVAVDMSQDHRPTYPPERRRVEELGAVIDDGYLNGLLSVTRALGDWDMKLPLGSSSPLIAEPDFRRMILTEDDEFLIIGCDGIWDVMSSQHAVSLVRRALRRHDDPQQCAIELVNEALRLDTSDNLTVIVICFSSPNRGEPVPQRRRFRCCSLSEEARNKLKSLLEGN